MKTRIPLAVACAVAGSLATLLVTSTVPPRLHPAYGSEKTGDFHVRAVRGG